MRLKLINLKEDNSKKGLFGAITQPPLCHAFLAAMIPEDLDIDVEIIDEQIEDVDLDMECDAVALSLTTHGARRCYQYARWFKKRGRTVILGGYHTTLCPDEAQKFADSIVIGEAENVWPELLRDLVDGNLKPRYQSDTIADLSKTPLPRRDLLDMEKYRVPNIIITSRGCPYMCSYCASSKIYGKYRRRDPDAIIKEIKSLRFKKIKDTPLMFADDEFFTPKDQALDLMKRIEPLNISWFVQATVPALCDKELMKAASESGCAGIMVGLESFNPETHKYIKKFQNYSKDINKSVEYANSLGIPVAALLISGLDTDNEESLNKTVDILLKSRFALFNFSVLRAYPGTPLYENLLEQGRVTKRWWLKKITKDDPNYHVQDDVKAFFKPKHFTPLDLQIKTLEFNVKASNIFRRNRFKTIISNLYTTKTKIPFLRVIASEVVMQWQYWTSLRKLRKIKMNQE
ncbi:B12-binding domain-containing radical SAM protein [Nanoarchaeota archaeon]